MERGKCARTRENESRESDNTRARRRKADGRSTFNFFFPTLWFWNGKDIPKKVSLSFVKNRFTWNMIAFSSNGFTRCSQLKNHLSLAILTAAGMFTMRPKMPKTSNGRLIVRLSFRKFLPKIEEFVLRYSFHCCLYEPSGIRPIMENGLGFWIHTVGIPNWQNCKCFTTLLSCNS